MHWGLKVVDRCLPSSRHVGCCLLCLSADRVDALLVSFSPHYRLLILDGFALSCRCNRLIESEFGIHLELCG